MAGDEYLGDCRLVVLYYLVYDFVIISPLDPTNERGVTPFNELFEHVGDATLGPRHGVAGFERRSAN
jgi:hypothetical protein